MTARFFLRLQRKRAVTDRAYSSELALLPKLSHYSGNDGFDKCSNRLFNRSFEGKCDEISDQGIAAKYCPVVRCQRARECPAGGHARCTRRTAKNRSEFRAGH